MSATEATIDLLHLVARGLASKVGIKPWDEMSQWAKDGYRADAQRLVDAEFKAVEREALERAAKACDERAVPLEAQARNDYLGGAYESASDYKAMLLRDVAADIRALAGDKEVSRG